MAIFAEVIENVCINERYLCNEYIHFGPHRCYPPHDRSKLQNGSAPM